MSMPLPSLYEFYPDINIDGICSVQSETQPYRGVLGHVIPYARALHISSLRSVIGASSLACHHFNFFAFFALLVFIMAIGFRPFTSKFSGLSLFSFAK